MAERNHALGGIEKESAEMLKELRRLTQVVERIEVRAKSPIGGDIPRGDVQAMEGWVLSVVESYVTLMRFTSGSVASANAVARLKVLAEKNIDWQRAH